jgi:purine-binding chemotaxis protein CheW
MGSDAGQLVVFTLNGEAYGLPIQSVHEVIRYQAPRPVSASDPCVRGVISLRGRIVAVYDLGARLGFAAATAEQAKIVILTVGEELAGIVVDSVEEVLALDGVELEELPSRGAPAIDKVARVDERLILVLRAELLVGGGPPELRAAA